MPPLHSRGVSKERGGLAEDFLHVAGLVQVSVGNGTMRPFILVGIENTERRRDMTGPTAVEADRKIAVRVGMPIAGDDAKAIVVASALVREVGYEPVMVGSLATMGKYLIPGTPLGGEHTPAEIRQIVTTLK